MKFFLIFLFQTISVWNNQTGELESHLKEHNGSVNSISISNNKLVSCSDDSTIKGTFYFNCHRYFINEQLISMGHKNLGKIGDINGTQ